MIPPAAAAADRPRPTIVHAASEVVGFAKTGGLADVVGSLPRALERRGHRCHVFLPLYHSARTGPVPLSPTHQRLSIRVGSRSVEGGIYRATLPGSEVPVYLIEQPEFFERDDPAQGRGLYQYTLPNGQLSDYPDNCARFTFFCRAVLEALPLLDLWPDVLHLHDWQTGLIPVYLREEYRRQAAGPHQEKYKRIRTLFTIHNLAYRGLFGSMDFPPTGLDWRLFNPEGLEFFGYLSFLKGGLLFADLLNTVSPTYAREIQTPYYGCGMQGVLSRRRQDLFGIINGVDYQVWDPATDPHLIAHFGPESITPGKPQCKADLQRCFKLEERPEVPLLAMISRLVDQKGLDLLARAADDLLRLDTHLVVLGVGDVGYHLMLQDLHARHPGRVGVRLALDEPLAHRIEAGADIFLMPSQYEPCGLNQLYSLKYGTIPVVRAVGGLADTAVDATPQTLADGIATGFTFVPYTPAALRATVGRAVEMYRTQPESWRALQRNGMRKDWSWDHSAAEYEVLYTKVSGA